VEDAQSFSAYGRTTGVPASGQRPGPGERRRKALLIFAPLLLATSMLVAGNQPVQADDRGLPLAGAKPGVVKAASMTMYNASYQGVAEVPTRNGPIRSLKFTMDRVVNKPFSLTIDQSGDAATVIESSELVLDGNVELYSPTFKGKLFGLTPVTFTPEQPPPPTLPVLWFTDVTLELAYVSSDALTTKALVVEGTGAG
jgi:hypothetical protein